MWGADLCAHGMDGHYSATVDVFMYVLCGDGGKNCDHEWHWRSSVNATIPTIRQCRFCRFWRGSSQVYRACELGRELLITTSADERCHRFESGGVLPESYVDQVNITESEAALRLCEVGG